jgi:Tfp pilus assembly protein PilX
MHTKQRGIGLMGLIMSLFLLILVALVGMKLIPSYLEFRSMKTAINAIAQERAGASVADIRKAFDARATIDDFSSVKPADLEITKEGNQLVISFAYRKEVPLFGGVGMYIDYTASTR